MFIVFEGIDGAGKSTQISELASWLQSQGRETLICNDPGSTQLGEQLRQILLGKHQTPIDMRTEMMLFSTARTQLVEQIIKPALDTGKTVLLDRYVLSTVVYQGHAGNLDPAEIWNVNQFATDGLLPDLTFVFDLDTETAMQRLGDERDRMESRGSDYFEKVRNGFLAEAEKSPDVIQVVDATQTRESIQSELQRRMSVLLNVDSANL